MYDEEAKPADFPVGARVELHPACDLWMRGARFGTVRNRGRNYVWLDMDHLKRPVKVTPSNLRRID